MCRWRCSIKLCAAWTAAVVFCGIGCTPSGGPDEDPDGPGVPGYIGSAACRACHPSFGDLHAAHGHSQALKVVDARAPVYSSGSILAGVPDPPPGYGWGDLSYVIGGYSKAANFVDRDGFLLTDGVGGPFVQYNLAHPPTDRPADFAPLASAIAQTPYAYDCFHCHTTGAMTLEASGGRRQDGRPGVEGRWAEAGVQCEACHGPGSQHIVNPSAGNIVIDATATACDRCHRGDDASAAIRVTDGFIVGNQQSKELAASPHAGFSCTVCHNPHASALFDAENGIRNDCTDCHTMQNMGRHSGRIYVFGDYVEPLNCRSCHMPPAASNAVTGLIPVPADGEGRLGDTRSHLMSIDVVERDYRSMLTADGRRVAVDGEGKAAVTVDFVCQRCHHGQGNAFPLTLGGAASIADGMHEGP